MQMFVNTKTKEVLEAKDIMEAHPNVTFPNMGWSDEMISDLGYATLHFPETMAPGPYEVLVEGTPIKESDGKWYRSFSRQEVSTEEKEVIKTNQWNLVRQDRTNRLLQSDWTQLVDAPVNQEEWASYRQLLRDITETTDDPFAINWPNPPEAIKRT